MTKNNSVTKRQRTNRLYLSDEQKKKPFASVSATEIEENFIKELVYLNRCRSLSDMLIKLCFDKKFRDNFIDIPVSDLEKKMF